LSTGGFQKSIEAFQQAIAIEPGYAPPHAGLANAYSFAGYFGVMPPREAFPLSIKEAEIALDLDPRSSEALVARGMAGLIYQWDWERAHNDLKLALELSPNSSLAHWAYTEYLTVIDAPKAVDSALKALSLDPLSLPIMNLVAFAYLDRGMYTEATRMDEEMLVMNPGFPAAHWNLGIIHMLNGSFEDAIKDLKQSADNSGGIPATLAVLAHAYAKSGDEESAYGILSELEERRASPGRGYVSPVQIAFVYEGLGKTGEALDWLDRAYEERDGWLIFLNNFPRFESLRGEPRFRDLLDRMGLPEVN
jgi:tetratricopeptide (TPR) repeat protein